MSPPLLLIIGGSNGAGKTTFARPYTAARGLPFLNADDLTREYAEAGEAQALIKAGRTLLARVGEAIAAGGDFALETTLSGGYIHGVVDGAQAAGYRVELVYLFVESPAVAVARVAARVRKGGHDVPVDAVTRRYYRSKRNFVRLRERVEAFELYYSQPNGVVLVAKRDGPRAATVFVPRLLSLFKQDT